MESPEKSGWKVAGLLYDILGNCSGIFFFADGMFQTEIRIAFFIPVSGLRGCFSVNGTDLYKPVCSQNLELVNLVPESRLPFSTYIVPFTLKRTGRPETGIKYLNERGEGISFFFFALFGLRNIK